jgi:hypothetical protein
MLKAVPKGCFGVLVFRIALRVLLAIAPSPDAAPFLLKQVDVEE